MVLLTASKPLRVLQLTGKNPFTFLNRVVYLSFVSENLTIRCLAHQKEKQGDEQIPLDEGTDILYVLGSAAGMVSVSAQDDNGGCGRGELNTLQPVLDSHRLFSCYHICVVK
jgi:hypothetical protein